MAIYSLHHSHVGKATQKQPGTAGAHLSYITRASAVPLVLAEHMPTDPGAARAWLDACEIADRKNGRVIDKVLVALPVELDAVQRVELVRELMAEFGGGRVSWLVGIHDRGEDAHNPHAHILIRDKDHETGKRVFGTSEKGSTERIRALWETVANRGLERAGLDVRVDRRSLDEQGFQREAGIHVGPNVYAMEERGLRPVSIAQEMENGRVINWPEIDQGRTRAERQREIEQGWSEVERGRDKIGDRSTALVPVVRILPELLHQADSPIAAPTRSQHPDGHARVPTPPQEAVSGRELSASAVTLSRVVLLTCGPENATTAKMWERVAVAWERLTGLVGRLETAFGRIRKQASLASYGAITAVPREAGSASDRLRQVLGPAYAKGEIGNPEPVRRDDIRRALPVAVPLPDYRSLMP